MSDPAPGCADESASAIALELLDELRICLLDCALVLAALPDEVSLYFDELADALHTTQDLARQAFGAASLLQQGAAMDERWGVAPSRPRAIFARHGAAVRAGANRLAPHAMPIEDIESGLRQVPAGDFSQNVTGPRPRCTALVARSGEPCSSSAIYLGAGSFAAHCYAHASPQERADYRQHQENAHADVHRACLERDRLLRELGTAVSAAWLQRRQEPRPWLAELTEITRSR